MPNVADTAIARLEGLLANVPISARDDPRYIEAKSKLDMMKALNDNPVTGAMIDVGITLDQEVENLIDVLPSVANATLDIVRGLGLAIIDGLDNAFDAVGEKLDGKEPAVIAGITTATIGLLTVILLFHTAKKGL